MNTDVYVTGTSGVLGFETLLSLSRQGISACGVSRSGLPDKKHPIRNEQVIDVLNPEWFDPNNAGSTIIHFAGLSNPRVAFDSYVDLTIHEVVPHVEMVENLILRGWHGHLIYISSGGAVYGDIDDLPISEDQAPRPKGFYALQKLTVENALVFLANQYGFRLTILRVSNPYGSLVPKSGQGVIPILLDAALNEKPFTVFGSGEELRDYVHISDLLTAIDKTCHLQAPARINTLNIGSGIGTSLNKLISLVTVLTGKELDLSRIPSRYDVNSNILDISRAASVLEWTPEVSIQDGLKTLVSDYLNAGPAMQPIAPAPAKFGT